MRYILSGLAGVIIAASLFLIMNYLISNDFKSLPVEPPLKIITLTMLDKPDVPIEPIENPPPPRIEEIPMPIMDPIPDILIPTVTPDVDYSDILKVQGSDGGFGGTAPRPPVLPQIEKPEITIETTVAPDYPRRMRDRGIEGYVLIENTVNENGQVIQVKVIESSHAGFENAVKNSAVRWQYIKSDAKERKHRKRVSFVLDKE